MIGFGGLSAEHHFVGADVASLDSVGVETPRSIYQRFIPVDAVLVEHGAENLVVDAVTSFTLGIRRGSVGYCLEVLDAVRGSHSLKELVQKLGASVTDDSRWDG